MIKNEIIIFMSTVIQYKDRNDSIHNLKNIKLRKKKEKVMDAWNDLFL